MEEDTLHKYNIACSLFFQINSSSVIVLDTEMKRLALTGSNFFTSHIYKILSYPIYSWLVGLQGLKIDYL